MLMVVIIMTPSILLSVYGPREYKYNDESFDGWTYEIPEVSPGEYNIIFDQHSHTHYSDGILTVEQNVKWHIAHGFNAMVLTDHNNLKNSDELQNIALKYQSEFILIQGMEWTTDRLHMNFLGISEWNLKIPCCLLYRSFYQAKIPCCQPYSRRSATCAKSTRGLMSPGQAAVLLYGCRSA